MKHNRPIGLIQFKHLSVLFLLTSFAAFNAVLFTPALPKMVQFFAIAQGKIQETIIYYMVGYSIGQLFYGPLANRFGRKPILYCGIILEILSSLLCVVAFELHALILLNIARFLLAMGAGVGLVLAYAIVNETFTPVAAAKRIAYLTLSFAISPGISIFIGSVLLVHYGISGCFYASFVYGCIILILTFTLPETLKEKDHSAIKFKHLLSNYKQQFTNINVLMCGVIMGANAAYIYIFAAIAPFIAMGKFGVSPLDYGSYNIFPPIGLVLGSVLSANLADKFKIKQLILYGLCLIVLGISSMVLLNALQIPNVMICLFLPCILVYFGSSLIHPNAIVFGMNSTTNKANASAVLNFLNLGIVALSTLFLRYCQPDFSTLLTSFVVLCLVEILIFYFVIARRDRA